MPGGLDKNGILGVLAAPAIPSPTCPGQAADGTLGDGRRPTASFLSRPPGMVRSMSFQRAVSA